MKKPLSNEGGFFMLASWLILLAIDIAIPVYF